MRTQAGIQTACPGPAGSCPPPAAHNQPDECHDHDGHPDDDGEVGLDAYIARLVAAAPPLSSQQRDTLALLLRRPRRTRPAPYAPSRPDEQGPGVPAGVRRRPAGSRRPGPWPGQTRGAPLAREVQCDRHQRLDHRARVSRPKGGIWRSRGRASRDGAPPPAASTPPNPPSTSPSALTTTFHRVGWHTSARPDPGRVRRDQLGKPSGSAHQGPVFPGPPPGAIKPQIAHRLRIRVDAQPGGIAIAGG